MNNASGRDKTNKKLKTMIENDSVKRKLMFS